jgi:hypothetical protein
MSFYAIKRHALRCGLVLLGMAACTGCGAAAVGAAGAAAGAGAVAYANGKLDSKTAGTVPVVQQATVDALNDLNLRVTGQRGDAASGRVESRYSDGTNLTIDLKKSSSSVTDVGIRVGRFGDQTRSQQVLDAINRHLPSGTAMSGTAGTLP